MMSRRVITRSGRHFRGRYPSRKMGRMVEYESLIERDLIQLLEFSTGVVSFQEQPERLEYFDGLKMREYFPDFAAELVTGEVLHLEAKPQEQLESLVLSTKLSNIAKHYAAHRSESYRVITDTMVRRDPLYSNLRRLSGLRARPIGELDSLELPAQGECWASLQSRVGVLALTKRVALGIWRCDLEQPLEGDLLVQSAEEVTHDSLYL